MKFKPIISKKLSNLEFNQLSYNFQNSFKIP